MSHVCRGGVRVRECIGSVSEALCFPRALALDFRECGGAARLVWSA